MTEVDYLEIECPDCGEIEKIDGKLVKPGYKRWVTCSSCKKRFRYERPKGPDIISRASEMYEKELVEQEKLPPLEIKEIEEMPPAIDAEEPKKPDGHIERLEIQKGPPDEPKIVHLACPSCGSRILKIIGTGPEVFREKRYSGISAVRTLFQAAQESAIKAFMCSDCGHSWWMISGEFDSIEDEGDTSNISETDEIEYAEDHEDDYSDSNGDSTSTEPLEVNVPKIAGKTDGDTNSDCCFSAFIIAMVGFGVILFFSFLKSCM